jgi:hypothetical protein
MISMASWQLLLLLCVATYGEPLAKVKPGSTGTHCPIRGPRESLLYFSDYGQATDMSSISALERYPGLV